MFVDNLGTVTRWKRIAAAPKAVSLRESNISRCVKWHIFVSFKGDMGNNVVGSVLTNEWGKICCCLADYVESGDVY